VESLIDGILGLGLGRGTWLLRAYEVHDNLQSGDLCSNSVLWDVEFNEYILLHVPSLHNPDVKLKRVLDSGLSTAHAIWIQATSEH